MLRSQAKEALLGSRLYSKATLPHHRCLPFLPAFQVSAISGGRSRPGKVLEINPVEEYIPRDLVEVREGLFAYWIVEALTDERMRVNKGRAKVEEDFGFGERCGSIWENGVWVSRGRCSPLGTVRRGCRGEFSSSSPSNYGSSLYSVTPTLNYP
ncbi:hypothetical protein RIF29_20025 [Crotalaria pallida]|uniref:Uncharacterized protein n=1 Tax=Crotalaria pallida TaxID=3830 RepID=A0AAN9I896_CROPI